MKPVYEIHCYLPVSRRCSDAWPLAKYLLMSQVLEEHNLWRNKPEFGNPHATWRDDTLSHSRFCVINRKVVLNIYNKYKSKVMVMYKVVQI
jgi:hypothetical protein